MKKILLSTGKEIEPNNGFIGISDNLSVCEGYDSEIYDSEMKDNYMEVFGKEPLTAQERIDLADEMITRWVEFRQQAKAKP